MKLQDLMETLAGTWGASLKKREGIYHLTLDSFHMSGEPSLEGNGFYLYTSLGNVPEAQESCILKEALSGNLFGTKTGHASLGFVPKLHDLVLFQYFDENTIDEKNFEDEALSFLNFANFWEEKLENMKKTSAPIPLQHHLRGLEESGNMKIFFA